MINLLNKIRILIGGVNSDYPTGISRKICRSIDKVKVAQAPGTIIRRELRKRELILLIEIPPTPLAVL